MAQGVVVCVEVVRNELSLGTREALALGRALSDTMGGELAAVLLSGEPTLGTEAIYHGADVAYLLADPLPAAYQPESYGDVAEQVCCQLVPQIILLPHTPFGCDLAPRLAFHLGIDWAGGCLDLQVAETGLVVARPFVGGKILLEEEASFPALVTIRARTIEPLGRDAGRVGEVRHLALAPRPGSQHLHHLKHIASDGGVIDELAEAAMIVSGGLGMGSKEGFDGLAELARLLGARVGASKAAVDRGWAEPERQVGLTGVTVAPRLYLAVGISGSSQHMAGCAKSRSIVAINKDPEANVFSFCKYGLVAEWEQALPILLARLKETNSPRASISP